MAALHGLGRAGRIPRQPAARGLSDFDGERQPDQGAGSGRCNRVAKRRFLCARSGGSTSHQLWSSAMVITPTLRGMFGISIDAQSKTITVNPHLPANWDHAELKNLAVGNERVDLLFSRSAATTKVKLRQQAGGTIGLRYAFGCSTPGHAECMVPGDTLTFVHPQVEIDSVSPIPTPGDPTEGLRVLGERYGDRPARLTLTLQGRAATEAQLPLVIDGPATNLHADGATLVTGDDGRSHPPALQVHFPPGEGWKTITVTLTW